jgi:methionyl-tRNA formyltransferase
MRIVFCGTPEFAVPALRRLASATEISVEAVITQPDRPRGRGRHFASSPVKTAALEAGLKIYQPDKIKSVAAQAFLEQIAPDAIVIIAYGQIISPALLKIPRLGWFNLHASLLPRYRGAAPIHWAIANGETTSGVTTMQIDAGLDTGPVLLQRELKIGPDETTPELASRMSETGASLMLESLLRLDRAEIVPVPQKNEEASSAPILKKETGRIEWSRSSQEIYNRIRGFTPWPGAYTTFRSQMCRLWGRPSEFAATASSDPGAIGVSADGVYVACGADTFLRVEGIQLEGRKRVSALEFAHGARLVPSDRFE